MSANVAGFPAFAIRVDMCCQSLRLMPTNVAGFLDEKNVSTCVVYLYVSCLQT